MLMIYEGLPGDHVAMSAKNAITLAEKYNRNVQMRFNDIVLTVNKRLSVKHVVGTWQHMFDARQLRYQNSPSYRGARAKRRMEVAFKQHEIDALMAEFPGSKNEAIEWIAKWVPLADDIGVDRKEKLVADLLRSIGFVSDQHVGAPEFKAGTASLMMRIEYIAGQVISMLESVGCVHPMIGKWAAEAAA